MTTPTYDFVYLSEDLPLLIEEREIYADSTVPGTTQFRDDFIWLRVMDGEIHLDVDGCNVTLKKDECLFINSNTFHELLRLPEGSAVFRILIAKPDAVDNPLLAKRLKQMIDDPGFSSTIIRPASPLFYADMDAMFDLVRHRPQEYEFELLAHYLNQLRQIVRIYGHTKPDETIVQDTDLNVVREMMAFIGENYSDELTLDQIAAAGKVSRSKCTRLFRTFIQKSPMHHLQSYRLERSVYLLTHTDFSISEIASKCGFNQQSYFNRLFLRTYGMTPKQMRTKKWIVSAAVQV